MSRFKAEVASTRARMTQVSAILAAIVQAEEEPEPEAPETEEAGECEPSSDPS